MCHVYRGVDQTTPLGASGGTTRTTQGTTTASYPTLTLTVSDGTSWIAGLVGARIQRPQLIPPRLAWFNVPRLPRHPVRLQGSIRLAGSMDGENGSARRVKL
ncbi:MAG: hypothetical protein IPI17_18000 [Nitrosomonas sp.]|nr:hypothetical protein [Nitrosomonas sp.]